MLSVAKNCLSPGSAPFRDASTNNLKKQDSMDVFKMYFIDYNTFDTSNIIDIHKYLMKRHDIKSCLC